MSFSRSNGYFVKFWILFSAVGMAVLTAGFSAATLAALFHRWHGATLESYRIEAAKQALVLFAGQTAFPLAAEDRLVLKSFFQKGTLEKPFLYIALADEEKIFQYHSDPNRVGSVSAPPEGRGTTSRKGRFQLRTYRSDTGVSVLDLSTPVSYRDTILGYAHLGLSLSDLGSEIDASQRVLFHRFPYWVAGLLAVALGCSVLFALTLGRFMDRKRDRQNGAFSENAATGSPPLPSAASPRGRGAPRMSEASPDSSGPQREKIDLCPAKGSMTEKFARNHVTVLFAGVRGFRSLADDRNAANALRSLNAYFAMADDIIREYGGVIDKFIGDAVIGVFGGSPLNPDHCERAVRCASALQKALQKAGEAGNPIMRKIGIGISSGVVISAQIGPRAREECAFLGESFKLAYSLNVMAGPGEILISKDVYRKIEGKVSVRPVPPREIMERTEPWEIFRFHAFTEHETKD